MFVQHAVDADNLLSGSNELLIRFAALKEAEHYVICDSGAALGYGVGPLLLKRPGAAPLGTNGVVLCPGALTTAAALFRYFDLPVRGLWFDTWEENGNFREQPVKSSSLYHIIGAISEYQRLV